MNRKSPKKNKPNRSPLSVLDSCIYWLALFLSIICSVIVLFCFEAIQKLIAFSDPTVIADVESANFLLALPLLLFLDCSAIIFFMGKSGYLSESHDGNQAARFTGHYYHRASG